MPAVVRRRRAAATARDLLVDLRNLKRDSQPILTTPGAAPRRTGPRWQVAGAQDPSFRYVAGLLFWAALPVAFALPTLAYPLAHEHAATAYAG